MVVLAILVSLPFFGGEELYLEVLDLFNNLYSSIFGKVYGLYNPFHYFFFLEGRKKGTISHPYLVRSPLK